ncbi:hypothetical protein EG329_011888 [Mollisiaceae sp. DMI_Dod_QoI]|nr:hypothetical protein EG329_011888 [Helotiales sp. DMI_Dod_QoI]
MLLNCLPTLPLRQKAVHSRNFIFLVIFIALCLIFKHSNKNLRLSPAIPESAFLHSTQRSQFWHTFAPKLYAAKPECAPPKLTEHENPRSVLEMAGSIYTPINRLSMIDHDIVSMKRSHALFLSMLDFDTPSLEYSSGTRGIVTTAGGSYFPVLLVSLLMLRHTGSQLPVEIFLQDDDEYEPLLCESVFPKLNARCISLSPLLSSSNKRFEVGG